MESIQSDNIDNESIEESLDLTDMCTNRSALSCEGSQSQLFEDLLNKSRTASFVQDNDLESFNEPLSAGQRKKNVNDDKLLGKRSMS